MDKKAMWKKHPEVLEGEVFYTNADQKSFELMAWETKRKGKVAYDCDNNPLSDKGVFPVFIQRTEIVANHMDPDRLWWHYVKSYD